MLAPVIIYEDNHLLIVQKPPGYLSQPDGGDRPDLLTWAGAYLARRKPGRAFVGLVHRLDRSVGGVVALAKTSKAAARLSLQFRERSCEKIYLALVSGRMTEKSGRLDNDLVRVGSLTRLAAAGEKGKLCSLSWRLRAEMKTETQDEYFSLLEINLLTGFKHQIRAQLTAQGWPVLGDGKYGSPIKARGPSIGLWAEALIIDHPTKMRSGSAGDQVSAIAGPGTTEKERLIFRAEPAADLWPWSLTCRAK